jgi:hypothetical protein
MARQKSQLSQAFNIKPRAYTLFRSITAPLPVTRHWLGFYPDIGPLPDRIERVSEAIDYPIKLADPAYRASLGVLAINNWDVVRPYIQHQDPFLAKRFVGIVGDVIVPGHTLTPIDPRTWRQIGFEMEGPSNWNFAHPGPSVLRRRRIAETAIVVPPFWNYWHLFLEHLLPLIQAARLGAWGGTPLKVITRSKRPLLIDAVVLGLQAEGMNISILEVDPHEHLRLDRLLVAVNQCSNVERSYALAEAIPRARRIFSVAYQKQTPVSATGSRLYITRRGSKLRQILNEDELIVGLKRLNFTIFQPRWDNHPEQITAFTDAKIVVGVHGAGLTNIIFSSPGTKVLELFPNNHRKTSMLHLSAEHRLEHEPVFGSDEKNNQAFSVDVAKVLSQIEESVARST